MAGKNAKNVRILEIPLGTSISRSGTLLYPPKVNEIIINVFCELLRIVTYDPERAIQTTYKPLSEPCPLRQRLSATEGRPSNLTTLPLKDGRENVGFWSRYVFSLRMCRLETR